MKLEEMSIKELETAEKNLAFDSKNALSHHKGWEASQKLKLVKAELERRRNPLKNILSQVQKWFGN